MSEMRENFFMQKLSLTRAEGRKLYNKYLVNYGLIVEGLMENHNVDPLEFITNVDDALELETMLIPDVELQRTLRNIDRSKVKLWLFTNAYLTHGKRVVQILGIDDLFEGMTFCDYAATPIQCKPYREMFQKAMEEANVVDAKNCYFVGT